MKKFVRMVRRHRELLMNGFRSQGLSSGTVEGFNNRVKLTARKAYGFQTFEALKIAQSDNKFSQNWGYRLSAT